MNSLFQKAIDFATAGSNHAVLFLVAGMIFFASMGIGAKWGVWWSWALAALSFGYIALRLIYYPW